LKSGVFEEFGEDGEVRRTIKCTLYNEEEEEDQFVETSKILSRSIK